uniref:Uncharacterized protein n=1 Tax=Sinocyclocheilus grahami TaxID=75366 RepID=A0A672T7G9_SINGR
MCSPTRTFIQFARGRTRVNIGAAFQQWRKLKEREGLESDSEFDLFLLDRGVKLIFLCFTQLICVGFCLNILRPAGIADSQSASQSHP